MKSIQRCLIAVLTMLFYLSTTLAGEDNIASSSTPSVHGRAAVNALQKWYVPETGLYQSTGWWNSANAITALANFSRLVGTGEFDSVFINTLRTAPASKDGGLGFLNKYYDDEGWWALAWIDVYDLTHDRSYLLMANSIFSDMKSGWDATSCGGGLWWSKERKYKNAIANELFLSVAASLANREPDADARRDDLEWALKEWIWFKQSGMINGQHLINDGLEVSATGSCKNNGKEVWSYNQGVILGGLVELNRADADLNLPRVARSIARAAIKSLTDKQGVLHEPKETNPGADAPQFKGIFARNLMALNRDFPDRRYKSFLLTNAQSLWEKDRDASDRFGFYWTGPVDSVDAARQSSALDLLIAADSLAPKQ
jgi:predicted alpha-1,6-mannanase (GH76 family)